MTIDETASPEVAGSRNLTPKTVFNLDILYPDKI